MIARLSARYAMAAVIALAVIVVARPAAPQAIAPAAPQTTAPVAQPSPAAILLAKQIIEMKGVKRMFDPIVYGVVEKAKNVFLQTNFMWAKDLNEVAAMMHKEYDSRTSELVDVTARIYASHFTEAELQSILAFYQSPIGQKVIVNEPKALDESMAGAAEWADNISADIMAKMRLEMKKRGHDM